MAAPCIISVAITGSVPRKRDNPAVPITVPEQVESTHAAYEAGAALVHVHVRNEDETPSSDPDKFDRLQQGIRRHCPDMIVQFSTGGRGRGLEARGAMLHLKPDMASLATGSVNFPTIVYENPPDFVRGLAATMRDNAIKPEIEVFDLAMLYNTADLVAEGLIEPPPHVQFVFGVRHALPARRDILEFEVAKLRELLP
ncbi:MAG: 3-keto-5-aminohexanoate cleavage protein, partial [Acetobacteraceae bacterium]|nr:3-keto-5-aminohexanoate cleavage protein [Acetobacteraceae bacterium]